jgi:hypothetical protein
MQSNLQHVFAKNQLCPTTFKAVHIVKKAIKKGHDTNPDKCGGKVRVRVRVVDSPYPFESTRYGVTKWWGVFKFQRCPT